MIRVGMAEWHMSGDPGMVFQVPGLGSCVGLVIYDPIAHLAAMAHIMLPDSALGSVSDVGEGVSHPAKFADTAVPLLANALTSRGAHRRRLQAKAAGGAKMFRTPGPGLALGARNSEAVLKALAAVDIPVAGTDLGGTCGRTIRFHLDSCRLEIRSTSGAAIDL